MDPASLSAGVLARDRRALARALSLVENDAAAARGLLDVLDRTARRGLVVGVTGPPGAGKSTLVSQLITAYRSRGSRVGVLAVDPSSAATGGAVLGDRVRMQPHALDPDVFIRSTATRGHAGGLARSTRDAVSVLEAAGFDVVIIETIGVGQAEIDVVRVADVAVIVLAPRAGDEIQAMKAGIMEVGDVFVLNKADLDGADAAVAALTSALALDDAARRPAVLRVVATTGEGVAELVAAIDRLCEVDEHRGADRRPRRGVSSGAAGAARSGAPAIRLDHVAVAVDTAAAETFLVQCLGLPVDRGEVVDSHHVRVRFVATGSSRIELVEPTSQDSPVARFLRDRGPGLHHIALSVPDLERVIAELEGRGVRLVDRVPRRGAHGRLVAFVHPSSAGGVLVELIQQEPERP